MSTLQIVQQLLIEEFGLTQDQIHAEARLDELGVDSLATIEFMFRLEDRFKLPPAERTATVRTVGDIAAQIDRLISLQQGAARRKTRG